MSMGMSYDLFWDGDCYAVKAYRKLNEIKQERQNELAWQIGLYCYEAIAAALSGKRRVKYPDAPHPLNTSISEERKEKQQEANERKTIDYMMTFMNQWNKRYENTDKATSAKNSVNANIKNGAKADAKTGANANIKNERTKGGT